jgi:hypothetical protein
MKTKRHKQDNKNLLRSHENTLYISCQLIQNLTNVKMQNINGPVKQLIIIFLMFRVVFFSLRSINCAQCWFVFLVGCEM